MAVLPVILHSAALVAQQWSLGSVSHFSIGSWAAALTPVAVLVDPGEDRSGIGCVLTMCMSKLFVA